MFFNTQWDHRLKLINWFKELYSIKKKHLDISPDSQWPPAPHRRLVDGPWLAWVRTQSMAPHSHRMSSAGETRSAARCPPATGGPSQSGWVRAKRATDRGGASDPEWPAARWSCSAIQDLRPELHPACRRFCCPCNLELLIFVISQTIQKKNQFLTFLGVNYSLWQWSKIFVA